MEIQNMTDEQILQKLLAVDDAPTKTVVIPRLGIPVTLKGLTGKQVSTIRDRCTEKTGKGRNYMEKLDSEEFNASLIAAATIKPNWGDPQLMSKFKASSPAEVVRRLLLAGELDAIGDEVLGLSGYGVDLEEVKNG